MRTSFRITTFLRVAAAAALLLALPASAQLDLGSHDIPQDRIDAHMAPFYRLVAAGLGADRHLPAASGPGWHAGLQASAVPIPDGEPFDDVALWALPLARAEAGARRGPLGAMARGMVYTDPRMGELSAFGAALSLGRPLPGPAGGAARADLVLAWDRLDFASEYTYRYQGTVLGLGGQDIPGDYSLAETLLGAGLRGAWLRGPWGLTAETHLETATGRFRYLYVDPVERKQRRVASDLGHWGFRAAGGLAWRGFRVQAGWRDHFTLAAGWAFIR